MLVSSQVDMRTLVYSAWGSNGTMPVETSWAAVYNSEPRIPLTLASPSLTSASFTIEAATIVVNFDRQERRKGR